MRATTVRPGDQHRTTDGEDIAFTVVSVTTRQRNGAPHIVVARVLYASGTEGDRVWAADTDVPLIRPDTAPRTVWKYRLDPNGTVLPRLRQPKVLTAATQNGDPQVWVEHGGPDPDSGTAVRLVTVPTGGDVPDDAEAYIGTVFLADGRLVFHVYRLTDQP